MKNNQHIKGSFRLILVLLLMGCIAITVVITGLLARNANSIEVSQWTQERLLPTVSVTKPENNETTDLLELAGRLQAYKQSAIYARVDGYINNWYFDIGDKVVQGDILAELDTPELDAQLLTAIADSKRSQAELELAESTVKRWRNLVKTKAVSEQDLAQRESEYRAAQAQLESATARVRQLEIQKSLALVKAPFDGIITARNKDTGDLINAGSDSSEPLFRLATTGQLRLNVFVPQKSAQHVTVGSKASVTVPDYPNKTYDAEVVRTNTVVDPQSGTMMVQIILNNQSGELLSGAYANVLLPLSSNSAMVTVPSSALIFNADGLSLAIVEVTDGETASVQIQPVEIARDLGRTVEIIQGIGEHQMIIANPPDGIQNGDRVRVVNSAKDS
jgi:RND family efflux transporter MFP subunit